MLRPLLALCLHLPELQATQKPLGVHQQDFTRAAYRYKGFAIPTDSSTAVHFRVSYARQKWKNEYFIVALSYFIFQTKHLLAPINTFKLLIKIARLPTGKAIK